MYNPNNYLRLPAPRVAYRPTYRPVFVPAVQNFLASKNAIQAAERQAQLDKQAALRQQAAEADRRAQLGIEQQRADEIARHNKAVEQAAEEKLRNEEMRRRALYAALNWTDNRGNINKDNFLIYAKDAGTMLGQTDADLASTFAKYGVFDPESGQVREEGFRRWYDATDRGAKAILAMHGYKEPKKTYKTYFDKSGNILNLPADQNPPPGYYTKESYNVLNPKPTKQPRPSWDTFYDPQGNAHYVQKGSRIQPGWRPQEAWLKDIDRRTKTKTELRKTLENEYIRLRRQRRAIESGGDLNQLFATGQLNPSDAAGLKEMLGQGVDVAKKIRGDESRIAAQYIRKGFDPNNIGLPKEDLKELYRKKLLNLDQITDVINKYYK